MPAITYRAAIRKALRQALDADERVFLIGEEIGAYGGTYAVTKGLLDEYGPERIIDTPIAEGGITGFAVGAAITGMRPILELMTVNFALLAMDQIVNHASAFSAMFNEQMQVPMVIRTSNGWGQLAATHSQTFDNYFAYLPGLKVVLPSTPADAHGLMLAAVADPNPVMYIEHSGLFGLKGEVPDAAGPAEIGRSLVRRAGGDVTLVGYSRMAHACLAAAEILAKDGIEAEVIDLRSLRPLDLEPVYESVAKTNRLVFAEEGWLSFGVGAEIAARVQYDCFDDLDAPIERVAAAEVPLPYNRTLELLAMPDDDTIVAAARRALGERRVLWPVK